MKNVGCIDCLVIKLLKSNLLFNLEVRYINIQDLKNGIYIL